MASSSRHYTADEEDLIRARWPDVKGIAASLGRTFIAINAYGIKLGLPCRSGRPKRLFTDAERQIVIDRYPTEGALPIARELGRKQADIVSLAQRLDVRCRYMRRWTPADDEQLLSLRQARKSYAEMAGALDRTLTAVSKRVQDLGLAKCQFDRDARRHKLVNSYQVRGVQAEVRWARARLRLGEHGWPPDLNPKEISILESLRTRGPQSRRNLSLSIGEPLTRPAKKRLMTHGGCSAVARLLARSLVTRCFLNSGRKRVIIYALTRLAEEARGTFPSVESFSLPISARRGDSSTPYRLEKAS